MWNLFPQLIFTIGGDPRDPDGGFGFEYLSQIAICIQNFISKDPNTFLSIGQGQTQTYIAQTFNCIERALYVNGNSVHKLDGIVIMKIIIAMLENLQNRIDEAMPYILRICVNELNSRGTGEKIPKNYLSMICQTLAMTFWCNCQLTFQLLEQNQWTIQVFQGLLQIIPQLK